jgi:hypothetical protein
MRIKGQYEIDISVSDEGYIVLKQRNGGAEPHVIEIAPLYTARIAEAIGALRDFALKKFDEGVRDDEYAGPDRRIAGQRANYDTEPRFLVHDA